MIVYNNTIDNEYLTVYFDIESKDIYQGVKLKQVDIYSIDSKGEKTLVTTIERSRFPFTTTRIPITGMDKCLFIIEPKVELNASIVYPCGTDVVNAAMIYNKSVLTNKGLNYISELGKTCNISRNFIDFILKQRAIDMAIETCNYFLAIKLWKMLMGTKGYTIKVCNCNGN